MALNPSNSSNLEQLALKGLRTRYTKPKPTLSNSPALTACMTMLVIVHMLCTVGHRTVLTIFCQAFITTQLLSVDKQGRELLSRQTYRLQYNYTYYMHRTNLYCTEGH